jgi:anti-sigma B factor antagonist
MPNPQLTITATSLGNHGTRVLSVTGPMLISNLFEFQTAFREESAPLIILDLTGVPFMDSAALGSVVNAHVSCVNRNHQLVLAGVSDRIATLFRLTKVDQVLKIFPTVSRALEVLDPETAAAM